MADNQSGTPNGKKNGKGRKARNSIVYLKCFFCGEQKREEDMSNRFWCHGCYSKQS